jgi:Ser/Thr protein kinase RdoA (MazF antagonist)
MASLLASHYGLRSVETVTPLHGGTANCHRVHTNTGDYVLKEFQPKYSVEDVSHEPEVVAFLYGRGFPVARFVPTTAGDTVWQHRGRAFHLQEYVDGTITPQNSAADWLLNESASLLGRLHRLLKEFPRLRQSFHPRWFRWDAAEKKREYAELIAIADEKMPPGQARERILADLRFKHGSVDRAAAIAIDPTLLTQRNSHGDYHISQIICGTDSVRAVIDFSSACRLPAVWEVIRSYTLADPRCKDGSVDAERLKQYIRLYVEHGGSLSRRDLDTIPHMYYLQLMRSLYGYREYLTGKGYITEPSPWLDQLIKFGLWRTEMCRWLEGNADALSRELGGLAG